MYSAGLAVFLGGGVGALSRFSIGIWLSTIKNGILPGHWITFLINLFASIGLALLVKYTDTKSTFFLLLGTGFCGGWSTYSTFSVEVAQLIHSGQFLQALAYISASLLVISALVYLIYCR